MSLLLVVPTYVIGGGYGFENKPESKYEIVIKIKYNEMEVYTMLKLAAEIMDKHDKACVVEIKTKKIIDNSNFTFSNGTTYYDERNGITYYDEPFPGQLCIKDDGSIDWCDKINQGEK